MVSPEESHTLKQKTPCVKGVYEQVGNFYLNMKHFFGHCFSAGILQVINIQTELRES